MNCCLICVVVVVFLFVFVGSFVVCVFIFVLVNFFVDGGDFVIGGMFMYLEYQVYMNLYLLQVGFYFNGGIVNNIVVWFIWQNLEMFEIELWIVFDWIVNDDVIEYMFDLNFDVMFLDGMLVDVVVVVKNFDIYGLGDVEWGFMVLEVINNYVSSEVVDEDMVMFCFLVLFFGFLQVMLIINLGLLLLEMFDGMIEDFGVGNVEEIIGFGLFMVMGEKFGMEYMFIVCDDYVWGFDSVDNDGCLYFDVVYVLIMFEDLVCIGLLFVGQVDYVCYVQVFDEDCVEGVGFMFYVLQICGVNNLIVL